jgi:hypothetical protein
VKPVKQILKETSLHLRDASEGLGKCPSDIWDAVEPITMPLMKAIESLKMAVEALEKQPTTAEAGKEGV